MIRIGILTNIPTPYRKGMWAEYATIPGISIDIYYCRDTEHDRNWRFEKAKNVNEYFLRGFSFKGKFHVNLEIIPLIKKYDLWVIGGYALPTMQLAMCLCLLLKIPYVIMFDGVNPDQIVKKERIMKRLLKGFFLRHQFACLANGKVGKLYMKKFGIPVNKIYNQYLTIDVNYFLQKRENKSQYRKEIRVKYDIEEDAIVLIYVGRLIKSKGVQDIIKAASILRQRGYKIHVLIVGSGAYEEELKKLANENKYIHFLGFIEYEILYKYYYASDIFIFPTYNDPWGLVVNEAMACGLPIITTTSCGAYMDLVEDNGVVYRAGDIDELVQSIELVLRKNLKILGLKSMELIKNYTYTQAKNEFYGIVLQYKYMRDFNNRGKNERKNIVHRYSILLIAPLPPPYNGQTIATELLVNSKIKELYNLEIINITSFSNRMRESGKFEIWRLVEILYYFFKHLIRLFIFSPDIVYITISQSSLGFLRDIPFIWSSKIFRKRCVIHLHGGYFRRFYENSPVIYKRVIKKTLRKVDYAVVLSESLRGMFEGIVPNNKIIVIPNSVSNKFILTDEELNNKIIKIKSSNMTSTFKVLHLSNLIPSKGYFNVLETALLARQCNLPIEFIFAGAWVSKEDEKKVADFIDRYKLDNVRFTGIVTGNCKREILLNSNVFVLPSKYEGLPISMLEAMGMGLPVIVTPVGGIPDVVMEGANGFFVSFDSPEEIFKKIKFLLYNKDVYIQIAINNVSKIKNQFTKDKYEEAFLKLFRELTDIGN